MSICKKRIISLFLFFSFTFISTVGFYFQKQQEAYAEPITLSVTGMYLLCASLLVASGVIIENSDDIISVASHAYNEFKNETSEMKAKIIEFIPKKSPTPSPDGSGWFKPTALGLGWLSNIFNNLKSNDKALKNKDYSNRPSKQVLYLGFEPATYFFSPGTKVTHGGRYTSLAVDTLYINNGGYVVDSSVNGIDQYAKEPDKNFITVDVQGIKYYIVKPPNQVLKDYTGLDIAKSSTVAVPTSPSLPPLTKEELHQELQSFVNSDFDSIKDKYANPEAVPDTDPGTNPDPGTDPGTDPGPGPGTDPGTDPGKDPGTEPDKDGVGDLNTDIPSDVKLDFGPLYVNLKDKFPFCVPFDLINVIGSFVGDKTVPRWEVHFDEGLVGEGTVVIDFSKFDLIVSILRYFVLLGFIVTLIVKTRDLIKG